MTALTLTTIEMVLRAVGVNDEYRRLTEGVVADKNLARQLRERGEIALQRYAELRQERPDLQPAVEMATYDPRGYWHLKPSIISLRTGFYGPWLVTTSAQGFRGLDEYGPRQPAVARIACMGDSVTFGYGVGDGEAFPAVLQRLLEERRNGPVEVVNAGTPGHSSAFGLAVAMRKVPELQPDVAVISYGINDFIIPIMTTLQRPVKERTGQRLVNSLMKLDLAVLLSRAVHALRGLSGTGPEGQANIPPEAYRKNLDTMARNFQMMGTDVILMNEVTIGGGPGKARADQYFSIMADVARHLGITYIDLRQEFPDQENISDYFLDFYHPNTEGHRIIAARLAGQLASMLDTPSVLSTRDLPLPPRPNQSQALSGIRQGEKVASD